MRLPDRAAAVVEGFEALDGVAGRLAEVVRSALPRPAKDALSGTWLGHPLHPLLTDIPAGAWAAAAALDLVGSPAADAAIAVGLAGVPLTAAAGAADWSDLRGETQRVGLVHAGANVVASLLYLSSLRARRHGHRGRGRVLAMAGLAAVSAAGFLGGHLTLRRGVGVDHTFDHEGPTDWTDADTVDDVLVARSDGTLHALADRCSHLGGPLHEGTVEGGCVTCPWHRSVFRLDDGSVVHGPATAPQPTYDVREDAGTVLVRRS
jgi:nitrite reductase/ring-hydroxylating ferredoxin subunit